jgi:prepilin-type N-terminal cleavage/methylation domain-containing protein
MVEMMVALALLALLAMIFYQLWLQRIIKQAGSTA